MTVNRSLSSKMLIIEKSLKDEKRHRKELEVKLGLGLSQDGPTQDYQTNGYPLNGNGDDLTMMSS